MRQEPGEPVTLPAHVAHGGSTAYHKPHRCRCAECLDWRRSYDRQRYQNSRVGAVPTVTPGPNPWYVCVDDWSYIYSWHYYGADDRCVRCKTDRTTEELWEQRWEASKP